MVNCLYIEQTWWLHNIEIIEKLFSNHSFIFLNENTPEFKYDLWCPFIVSIAFRAFQWELTIFFHNKLSFSYDVKNFGYKILKGMVGSK